MAHSGDVNIIKSNDGQIFRNAEAKYFGCVDGGYSINIGAAKEGIRPVWKLKDMHSSGVGNVIADRRDMGDPVFIAVQPALGECLTVSLFSMAGILEFGKRVQQPDFSAPCRYEITDSLLG